jgi:hypothetical protein
VPRAVGCGDLRWVVGPVAVGGSRNAAAGGLLGYTRAAPSGSEDRRLALLRFVLLPMAAVFILTAFVVVVWQVTSAITS